MGGFKAGPGSESGPGPDPWMSDTPKSCRPKNASPDIIEHHFPRISHLHLHDNHGGVSPKDDLHLPPGEGIVSF